MGDVTVHDGPEPVDRIEMRAIGRQGYESLHFRGSSERCIESLVCQKSQYRRGAIRDLLAISAIKEFIEPTTLHEVVGINYFKNANISERLQRYLLA